MTPEQKTLVEEEIHRILLDKAHRAKLNRDFRGYMTAYQILNRMKPEIREVLFTEYGPLFGGNAGHPYGAATYVAQRSQAMVDVETEYLDAGGLHFVFKDTTVEAGNQHGLCGLFRIKN